MFSSRTKHIATKFYLLRESVENGNVVVNHIPTGLQVSDLLTKNVPKPTFLRLRQLASTIVQQLVCVLKIIDALVGTAVLGPPNDCHVVYNQFGCTK